MKTKKLSNLTATDLQEQMSIAGSPKKITGIFTDMMQIIHDRLDVTNAAEIINLEFALKRAQAEVKVWKTNLEKRTGQKF